MTCPGGPPVPATRRRRFPLPRPLFLSVLSLLALGLAAGCTFERRPQTQVNAEPGQIQAPVPDEQAASFLEGLQAARLSGSEGELRDMLHPEVTVMLDGRILPLDGPEAGRSRAGATPEDGDGGAAGVKDDGNDGGNEDRDGDEDGDRLGEEGGDEGGDAGGRSAWTVLARTRPPVGPGGVPPTVTDSAVLEGGAFFVVDYEADVETFFLARDSAGWSLRLLHRTTGDGGSP
ncbi:MAG: hypothetical protein ACLFWG_08615 [Longimicrobiales bacterium]